MGFCGLVLWFVLSERKSVRIGLPTALSQLFLATFGNALCKDVAPIGVFGGVCLQAAARDFQCASVRLGKGLIFDKRGVAAKSKSFFRKYVKCNYTKKQREGRLMRPSLLIVCDFGSLLLSSISRMPTILRLQLPNR